MSLISQLGYSVLLAELMLFVALSCGIFSIFGRYCPSTLFALMINSWLIFLLLQEDSLCQPDFAYCCKIGLSKYLKVPADHLSHVRRLLDRLLPDPTYPFDKLHRFSLLFGLCICLVQQACVVRSSGTVRLSNKADVKTSCGHRFRHLSM